MKSQHTQNRSNNSSKKKIGGVCGINLKREAFEKKACMCVGVSEKKKKNRETERDGERLREEESEFHQQRGEMMGGYGTGEGGRGGGTSRKGRAKRAQVTVMCDDYYYCTPAPPH